ncbi:TolC family protein [Helicobacter fennelliae]|uniref:TolC family protein n=1 Tax=Helicobacter fennelliae TaxID=215 RepID=UPI000E05030F|nr:TolC family protein [Helicobacter fennelliae]STQ84773.1 outer membrane efflux protein [Helicobacter fennelliae]
MRYIRVLFIVLCGVLSAESSTDSMDFRDIFDSADSTKSTQPIESTESIDIKTAWHMVLDTSDALKAQELNTKRAEKLSLGSKLSFLPEINAKIAYLHLDKPIEASITQTNIPKSSLATLPPQMLPLLSSLGAPIHLVNQNVMIGALNIIYPLYVGGARYRAIKIADIAKKDAKEAYRLKTLATFEELVGIYYAEVLAKEVAEVLAQIKDGTALHYHNALDLEKSGQIAHIEVLGAQVADDKAQSKLKESKNALDIASLALQTALSKDNITSVSALAISDKSFESEEYYVARALEAYPALRSLELKIDSAKQAKKLAIAPFLPQVVGMGSYFFTDSQKSLLTQNIPTWYVGVMANVSILTSSARIQKYQAAKITQLELESLKAQAKKDLTLLVRKTYKQAVYARDEYHSLQSSIALARENLKLQQQAFKQGLATSAQVIDAQNTLQSALIEQKTICYKAIVALAKLLALSDDIESFYEFQH